MSKILFFVGIAFLIYLGFVLNKRKAELAKKSEDHPRKLSEKMVECAHCGVYLPEKEALQKNGLYFCSAEHARLGKK